MKKRTIGIALIVFPWILLPSVLAGYAIFSFMLAQSGSAREGMIGIATAVNLCLGLLGTISIAGLLIGTPIGLYLVSRKDAEQLAALRANPRFKDLSDEDFKFVTGWSWGAFFGSVVWALGNKLWLWALGTLVPFWNVYVWIKLSTDGRQLAWERLGETPVAFKKRQGFVAWVVVVFLVLAIVASVVDAATATKEKSATSSAKTVACATLADADGDDIPDGHEKDFGTDPTLVDTDADGYSDYAELMGGYDPNDGVTLSDADADGLADERERTFYGSDSSDSDSDDDGVSDLDEVRAGKDPDGSANMKRVVAMYQLDISIGKKNCTE